MRYTRIRCWRVQPRRRGSWEVWESRQQATGRSSEPDSVTLLKDPLVIPAFEHCIVDDINREDLVCYIGSERLDEYTRF